MQILLLLAIRNEDRWLLSAEGKVTAFCEVPTKCVLIFLSNVCQLYRWDCSNAVLVLSLPPGFVCERDRLTFSFCQTLRVLGRCHLPTVYIQCCQSCRQHGHHGAPDQDRGDERASRR